MLIGERPMDLEIQASLWVFPFQYITCIGSNCTSLPDAHVAQNVQNGLTSQELAGRTVSERVMVKQRPPLCLPISLFHSDSYEILRDHDEGP